MPTLPVFVLHNLALGITSVLPDFDPRTPSAIKPATILANMRNEGVTTLVASPAFCARLADHATQCATTLPLHRLFRHLHALTGAPHGKKARYLWSCLAHPPHQDRYLSPFSEKLGQ